MVEIVELPKLGLSDYGELIAWKVSVGDRVEAGDLLAVLESEKASAEIEAPASGVLLETYVDVGEEIAITPGRPIAAIGDPGTSPPPLDELGDERAADADTASVSTTEPAPSATVSASARKVSPRARRFAAEYDVDLDAVQTATGPEGSVVEADVRAHVESRSPGEADSTRDTRPAATGGATKRARRYATRHGISLDAVDGTGPDGTVTGHDVREHVMARHESDSSSVAVATREATDTEALTVAERRELSGTRRTIADRLTRTASEVPHVMGTREIRIDRLESARDRLRSRYGVEVALSDLVVYLVGRTLEEFPEFNAHFVDGEHRLIEEVNIGYAVDGPRGLVVPVVEAVSDRSLEELANARRSLVDDVLADEHTVSDLQDGTFTVTNVGPLGLDVSYSILNPPQVAILALGREKLAPVRSDRGVETVPVMTFSLTIDHRALDGADTGRFLERLAERLEYPGDAFDSVR